MSDALLRALLAALFTAVAVGLFIAGRRQHARGSRGRGAASTIFGAFWLLVAALVAFVTIT